MSNSALKLLAASGSTGGPVYVDDVFSTDLFAGTGSNQAITNGVDLSGEGGLVWGKCRNNVNFHYLFDTERGVGKVLYSNDTYAEGNTSTSYLYAFNNDGFSMGPGVSVSGQNHVGWTFRKQPGFFDIVTYTGNGTAGRAINHDLGSVPGFMVVKKLNSNSDWTTYHRSMGATKHSPLNDTDPYYAGASIWNNTAPTATQFTVGDNERMNGNGDTYVAYLFAHDAQDFGTDEDESIIKCGSYTGNGSTDGPTIDLGFEPQWLLIKNASASSNWMMVDNMRGLPVGGDDATLAADSAAAENGVIGAVDAINILPNGWKNVGGITASNANGATHIYMAIRRPHKPAEEFAATDLFTPVLGLNASANGKVFATTYPVDLSIGKQKDGSNGWYTIDRMRGGGNYLFTNSSSAQSSMAYQDQFDHMDGLYTTNGFNYTSWMGYQFRRAPGYFDVVAYTGTGSAQTVSHNLGVAPEMVWVKSRNNTTSSWSVTSSVLGAGGYMFLISTGLAQGVGSNTDYDNNTSPTSTVFYRGAEDSQGATNYIAYLFASVSGISKVGSYTGTGNDLNVDCGFSAGARLVLIKRTDATGAWYLWDSVRGIVAGNDPYLLLNTTAAQVTNTDYIDPLSSGFTVTSSAPAALNASGGTYLFYAIA